MDRRLFLQAAVAIPTTSFLDVPVVGQDFWQRPRIIDLQRRDTGERYAMTYWQNGSLDVAGYTKVCEVMRDAHVGEVVQIDLRLLDLMCATQAWVRFYGYNVPYVIHSGYRSPKTNKGIEGAAKDSKHMTGEAVDFTVPGLPSEYMGKLAHAFLKTDGQGGGVGFYTNSKFTHMDTGRGRERVWRGK
jgi:uncharacterized protein YcbK (DUF882 family)